MPERIFPSWACMVENVEIPLFIKEAKIC